MRILWHSNDPRTKSGYGCQTALWVPLLAELGHDMAVSAFQGTVGAPHDWQGFPVYPAGDDLWGMDVLRGHAKHWRADLVITLLDCWVTDPAGVEGLKLAHLVPVDCEPLGARDKAWLETTKGHPIAFSRHSEKMLRQAGFDPSYVPHGVDTTVFTPIQPAGKAKLRKLFGIGAKRWVIGVNAANQDRNRKALPEQFRAFAKFRAKHPDALLLVHTRANNLDQGGLNLYPLAEHCGIEVGKDLLFTPEYEYKTGLISDQDMANWYRCLDVLSLPSWGEGFGIPLIEAQACGIPVVTTRWSAMTELCGAGWLCDGPLFWNYTHEADWMIPSVASILRAWEHAYREGDRGTERARAFALQYDARHILKTYWKPVLEKLA